MFTKGVLVLNNELRYESPFLPSHLGPLSACPEPSVSASTIPSEMPLLNQWLVDTETERIPFAPFYASETQARYLERWNEFNRGSAILASKALTDKTDLEIGKSYQVIKELVWAIEIALIDTAQRFGPDFVSRASMALSKAQRLAVYQLHLCLLYTSDAADE